MSDITFSVKGDALCVRGNHSRYNLYMTSILGGQWDETHQAWNVPLHYKREIKGLVALAHMRQLEGQTPPKSKKKKYHRAVSESDESEDEKAPSVCGSCAAQKIPPLPERIICAENAAFASHARTLTDPLPIPKQVHIEHMRTRARREEEESRSGDTDNTDTDDEPSSIDSNETYIPIEFETRGDRSSSTRVSGGT